MPAYQVAAFIKAAFEEGWASYTSAASSMTTLKEEWENSTAKIVCDDLLSAPSFNR